MLRIFQAVRKPSLLKQSSEIQLWAFSQGHLTSDRFLTIYDLRTLRSLPPNPVGFDPMFLRFLPAYSENQLIVASQVEKHDFSPPESY